MKKILATIKAPVNKVQELQEELTRYGVAETSVRIVPYDRFCEESRFNYDFVFPEMLSDGRDVAYLDFSFDATDAGRAASFQVEYHLMQIPLNLRYELN